MFFVDLTTIMAYCQKVLDYESPFSLIFNWSWFKTSTETDTIIVYIVYVIGWHTGSNFTASASCRVVTSVPLTIFLFSHLVSSGAFIVLLLLSGKCHLLSAQVRHQARAQGVSQNVDCGAEPDSTCLQEDGSRTFQKFLLPNKILH